MPRRRSLLAFVCVHVSCAIAAATTNVPREYFFNFTAVRALPYDAIQLSSVVLVGRDAKLLSIVAASNPGGQSPADQGPNNLLLYQPESVVKWMDGQFGSIHSSLLQLRLASPDHVGAYWLLTAGDLPRRDPLSWSFGAILPDGSYTVLHTVDEARPPLERNSLFDAFYLVAPPPPPHSPSATSSSSRPFDLWQVCHL